MPFSDKQLEYFANATRRWNFKTGATRSGKTFMDYTVIPKRIFNTTGSGLVVLLGNTQQTLERNIFEPMRAIWGGRLVGNIQQGTNTIQLFGRRCHALGADKITSTAKIQGAGIEYCYGDEVPTWNPEVFQMLKSRLDKPNSAFDGTGNPAAPTHWLKAFLDSDADIYHQQYTLDDNPFLTRAFVENLKKEYAGTVYYDRYVMGRWVRAEGVIYPMFNLERHTLDTSGMSFNDFYISLDYGTSNPFSAGLWGRLDGVWYRIKDIYYDGRAKQRQLTDEDYYKMVEALAGDRHIRSIVIDPSAASFIACIKSHRRFNVRPADNSVLDGIRNTATALNSGRIMFDKSCKALIDEIQGYVWDERSEVERPIKEKDHAMDDMRYFVQTILYGNKIATTASRAGLGL